MTENNYQILLQEQLADFNQKNLGVEREALALVQKQLKTPYAVVISGLRRVGKSTLLAQIARRFYPNQFYFLNFEDERFLSFQAQDFNQLYQLLIGLFGLKKVFLFDEIQNVIGWEHFVRRLIDEGNKVFLTGSNASLLSKEVGTKLTGRYASLDLLPFSFREFLTFKSLLVNLQTTKGRGLAQHHLGSYLKKGGLPNALRYPTRDFHQTLYQDILYRDVASRYQITEVKALKELAFFLISNTAGSISFNKIKNLLKLGSVNTVKNYIDYLVLSWLFFTLNRYSFSVKRQQIAPKKIYCIDTGLVSSVGFSFSPNRGRLLENLVFLTLRRHFTDIYYYKTQKGQEIDFYLPRQRQLVQVCQTLADPLTRQREIAALVEAMGETHLRSALIITENDKAAIKTAGCQITITPLTEWLLNLN
jgi:predicted AAA+ superfamily ATPase